ncbi:MAG: WD40 repeat-containing protein [Limisphaerales bacterium]|nr:MAG: WD40 repeat-containing protein [Limisphaerales bacterium]KAG0509120.1 MAG: WD40 repeat-containing protein [Limisphaerales bacterium]TXT50827.1 MAG: WD40 repeat-containing protein [Limisphaerales bacterium]
MFTRLFVSVLALAASSALHGAETDTHAAAAMTILRAHCFSCHNVEKKRGQLDLTSREAAIKGGETGPALKPGKSSDSPLVKQLLPGSDPHMPPKKQLPDKLIATLRGWVDAGAPWDAGVLKLLTRETKSDELKALPASYTPVLAVSLAPDGKRLASARGNQLLIHTLGSTNRTLTATLTGARDAIQSIAWSADGRWLAAGEFRRVLLFDAKTLQPFGTLDKPLAGRATAVAFTPDGSTLAVADSPGGAAGQVHLWKMGDEKPFASWTAHNDSILDLKISASGKLLATGSADKLARVWNLATQKEVAKLEGHTSYVQAVAFGKDDAVLATGGADKEIKIWDIASSGREGAFSNRSAAVTALHWTTGGTNLLVVAEDGSASTITDLKRHSGEQSSSPGTERKLSAIGEVLYAVTATPDAKTVFAGCHDGSVYVWEGGKTATKLEAK